MRVNDFDVVMTTSTKRVKFKPEQHLETVVEIPRRQADTVDSGDLRAQSQGQTASLSAASSSSPSPSRFSRDESLLRPDFKVLKVKVAGYKGSNNNSDSSVSNNRRMMSASRRQPVAALFPTYPRPMSSTRSKQEIAVYSGWNHSGGGTLLSQNFCHVPFIFTAPPESLLFNKNAGKSSRLLPSLVSMNSTATDSSINSQKSSAPKTFISVYRLSSVSGR